MDVACFCGRRYALGGDVGACPACGEYVTVLRVSDADERQMRAELDLLLMRGAATRPQSQQERGNHARREGKAARGKRR